MQGVQGDRYPVKRHDSGDKDRLRRSRRKVKTYLVSFGIIEVAGRTYEHDVVIDRGHVRKRDKKPSKGRRGEFGHTPLTAAEAIPWTGSRLVIGTGASGQLPVTDDVFREAEVRGVSVVALKTSEACQALADVPDTEVCAILHVTC
jgi:hypothetical protein